MKTPRFRLPAVLILPAALLLSQCAPTPPKNTQPQAAAATVLSRHWVKVSSHPPTFYPRGVAADCPTDCQSGEWVHTGDAQDTRYFIPLRGLTKERRMGLRGEALAARTPTKMRQIARDDAAQVSGTCLGLLCVPPLAPIAIIAIAIASSDTVPGGMNMGNFRPSAGSIHCPGVHGCPSGGGGPH